MSPNVKTLLEELYLLEPSLREKEDQIVLIIENMQKNRPNIVINEEFKNELRTKIMIELKNSTSQKSQNKNQNWNWWWIFAGLSTTAFAAFAGYALLGGLAFQTIPSTPSDGTVLTMTTSPQKLSFAPTITKTGENGFGNTIALSTAAPQAPNPEAISARVAGMGWVSSSKMMANDTMMPVQDFPYYQYSYTGTLPTVTGSLVVYRKNMVPFTSNETSSFLAGLSLDGINLRAFENSNVTNLSFSENRDFGYIVNMDFSVGNISIYQNWEKWPQPKCDANGCEQPVKLTEKDVPSDDEFTRIGDEFLAKYGIDRALYGTPKIDNSWRIMYARMMADNSEGYIPDQYTLTYPILLDSKKLYEEYGGYKGISLSIDIRTKKVVSMNGLEKQNLTSSLYSNLTDGALVEKMIPFGGRYETKAGENQKTVTVNLGEPTVEYIHIYGEWKDGKYDEYYVPAYVFPVLDKPEGSYLKDTVTIPLVADFAKFVPMTDAPIGVPTPLMMEKAVQ